jgi:hypothetical protein
MVSMQFPYADLFPLDLWSDVLVLLFLTSASIIGCLTAWSLGSCQKMLKEFMRGN